VTVLSKVNRISRASDFRATVRTGRKVASRHAVVYLVSTATDSPTRFGFIVSKAVGNSVVRHFVTRRLRAVAHEVLPAYSSGLDVIVRALPGTDEVAWAELRSEVTAALARHTQSNHTTSGVSA
jgi:ribonuclease P protein component